MKKPDKLELGVNCVLGLNGEYEPMNPDDEYFVFIMPEGLEEGDEVIFSVLTLEEGLAILDAEG